MIVLNIIFAITVALLSAMFFMVAGHAMAVEDEAATYVCALLGAVLFAATIAIVLLI